MPYEVTATRKRPQTFAELVGQEFVAATLTSSIQQGRIAHAYLFAGPRGRGQDLRRPHPRQGAELRKGPDGTRRAGPAPSCAGDRARRLPRRDRDRRRLQHQRERRARDPRRGALRPQRRQVQGLHHRRGAHALQQRLQRAAEDDRGASPVHRVHLRHHRGAQGAGHHPLPLPAVQLPPHLHRGDQGKLRRPRGELGVQAEERALIWIAKEATGSLRDAYTLLDQVVSFSAGSITLEKIREKLGVLGIDELNEFVRLLRGGDAGAGPGAPGRRARDGRVHRAVRRRTSPSTSATCSSSRAASRRTPSWATRRRISTRRCSTR